MTGKPLIASFISHRAWRVASFWGGKGVLIWEKETRVGFSWEAASVVASRPLVAGEGTARGWRAALHEGPIARKSEARTPVSRYFRAQRKEGSQT